MKRSLGLVISFLVAVGCTETGKESIPVGSISLDPPTLTLTEGDTERLSLKIVPENADAREVSWESTNSKVATVSSGVVQAISTGSAQIKATVGGKTASCAVTVSPKSVAVSSVTLNKNALSLLKGAKETLIATVLPENATEKTVAWSSSNDGVATVTQAGEVSAISSGSATITASAGGSSATCQITVMNPLESISFVDGVGLVVDDMENHRIAIVLNPEDASVTDLVWKAEDENILAISSEDGALVRYVKAVNNGTTTVSVSSASYNVSASIPVEVKVKVTLANIGKGTWNDSLQDWDWERIYVDYYGTFGEVLTPVVYVEPELAYTDDGEFDIRDEEIAAFNDEGEIVFGNKEGETLLTVSFPYSNYTTQIMLRSKEYLYDAGIRNIQQRDETNISFGGRIYTNVPSDQFIVNSIHLCDNQGYIISSTIMQPEPLTMYGNNTNYIRFWTPFINMSQKYGIGAIIQSEFDPFISQWYFYITYQTKVGGEAKYAKLFINPSNWSADY
ncbi:MAG: Ig domain-containing protein [Prevotella sp.]|nr:Ig domain-containing protein [Prevotella sp.]